MMEDILPVRLAFEQYRTHYDNGGADYSVSELIQPPRITLLQKRHWQEILKQPLDIRHHYDSFDGTGMHMLFEKMLKPDPNFILEKRLSFTVLGKQISGCPDCIHDPTRTLYDFKKTSVWKKIFGDTQKWEEQLNLYKLMIDAVDKPIKNITVVAWWKDWSVKDLKSQGKDYPREKIETVKIPMWKSRKQEDFLHNAVQTLIENEVMPDDYLQPCTPEDMWERNAGWAVMPWKGKKRGTKAARVLSTEAAALQWKEENLRLLPEGWTWSIEERKGTRTRCEEWCDCKDFCSQWKEYKHGKKT